jgi:DNA-binding NarL/FixJ family response regulator
MENEGGEKMRKGPAERTAVVLDQHPLWLEAMEQLLQTIDIHVVGRATELDEAIAMAEEHGPDLLITDVGSSSGSEDALTRIQSATEAHPEMKWVVFSEHESQQQIEAAFAAGASLYCLKTVPPEDLSTAIRQVFDGSIYLAGPHSQVIAPGEASGRETADLTRREIEILQLVAEGHSNAQLARMLWVTEQTVKFHLSNIYRKLEVANRTEASRWAQVNGLLSPPPEKGAPRVH